MEQGLERVWLAGVGRQGHPRLRETPSGLGQPGAVVLWGQFIMAGVYIEEGRRWWVELAKCLGTELQGL